MNLTGDELLPSSGFPLDQHDRVGRRYDLGLPEDAAQRDARSDDLVWDRCAANILLGAGSA